VISGVLGRLRQHSRRSGLNDWEVQAARWSARQSMQGGPEPSARIRASTCGLRDPSKDDPKAWAALIALCKVLTQTPLDQLERALAPIFDVDAALKFLALESALINDDGYWVRSSDYNLYLDERGRFHIYPHDGNEAFYDAPPNIRGSAARGTDLDPFIGSEDPNKVLLSRLLAVPALRTRFLAYVKDIATTWLTGAGWARRVEVSGAHRRGREGRHAQARSYTRSVPRGGQGHYWRARPGRRLTEDAR
jgi:hypothetical protein